MRHAAAYTGGAAKASPPAKGPECSGPFPRDPLSKAAWLPPEHVPGWTVLRHATLDSTNLEARRLIERGETGKRLIVADAQTNGQCRHDRLWESPAGKGIWASFILPVAVPLETLPQSTLVLAVAVREGIMNATGVSVSIKWPNDLLGNGKKCCGLLVETAYTENSEHSPLILGVGINNKHEKNDFPEYLQDAATSLSMLSDGKDFCRKEILRHLTASIAAWFATWEEQGFSPVRAAWLAGNCTIGNRIALPEGYGHSFGTAYDLEGDGALVALTDDGTALRIDSGEIRLTNAT